MKAPTIGFCVRRYAPPQSRNVVRRCYRTAAEVQKPLSQFALQPSPRRGEVARVQFYADELAPRADAGDSRCSASHERVQNGRALRQFFR